MQVLINSYSPNAIPPATEEYKTVSSYDLRPNAYSLSITIRSNDPQALGINNKILETLGKIEELQDNWDEDGSHAPPKNVLQTTKALIYLMGAIGQEIYNIAPGPQGEIMIDFRNSERSLEVLIYPDKMKYVQYFPNGDAKQGIFTLELLYSDLISWLNS